MIWCLVQVHSLGTLANQENYLGVAQTPWETLRIHSP